LLQRFTGDASSDNSHPDGVPIPNIVKVAVDVVGVPFNPVQSPLNAFKPPVNGTKERDDFVTVLAVGRGENGLSKQPQT
jgi:hypothetical protein